ncbi:DUF6705 family protein [Bizionia paragorgiae]|jgi:hypothetical protein|uniref:DUF6705 family protein n=1 Tax=Bizionia paragorgiae TaxID=283786 RepID=UPI0029A185C0|nr:DUF6705 family protein [Xanthomarina gelatinilytica]
MKNIILIVLMIVTFTCKAQSPIVDIADRQIDLVDGVYLKDVNNELDKFIGTWLYTNGNTSLIVKFQKKTQVYSGKYYRDILVGEYRYIENGIEKINTLPNFDNQDNLESLYEHSLISSLIILKREFPGCSNCNDNEKRVKVSFSDPSPNLSHLDGMSMGLRYMSELGVPDKMQIDFAKKGTSLIPVGAAQEPNLPFGRYVLTKQ